MLSLEVATELLPTILEQGLLGFALVRPSIHLLTISR